MMINTILGFMCGRIPVIIGIIIMIIIAILFLDRHRTGIIITGSIIMTLVIYFSISYIFFTILPENIIPEFTIFYLISLLDIITLLALIIFGFISVANGLTGLRGRKPIMRDNDWIFIFGMFLPIIQSVLYLLPFFYSICSTNSAGNIIILAIINIFILIIFKISKVIKNKKI